MPIRVMGLVGSLRVDSHNRTLLEAVGRLLPPGVSYAIYPALDFPLFAPDREAPDAVLRFRQALDEADAVLIASPEYAYGVTGVIKNALDWVVTSNQFSGKPVACLNASPASHHAWDALIETLRTMDARVEMAASIQATLDGPFVPDTLRAIVEDPVASSHLREAVGQLLGALQAANTLSQG